MSFAMYANEGQDKTKQHNRIHNWTAIRAGNGETINGKSITFK